MEKNTYKTLRLFHIYTFLSWKNDTYLKSSRHTKDY